MIIVLGDATGSAESIEELLALSTEHVARSRTEPGCLSHSVSRGVGDPNKLSFVERWADVGALTGHFAIPASRQFAGEVVRLTGGDFCITVYEANQLDGPR
jgi:quinol monooxygenase YgiN